MNRRLSAAIAVVIVAAGAIGAVGADRVLGSSSPSTEDVIRDAWTTTDGRAVVEISPSGENADWIAIEDGTRAVIAVEPPASDIMSIPLEVRPKVTMEATNDSRSDVVVPAAAVRGEDAETEPMEPGHYRVIAIEDGMMIDSENLTVSPAAVNETEDHG